MIAQVNYYKVGRADEIEQAGWIKVSLMGWNILVFGRDGEFIAIDLGKNWAREATTLETMEYHLSRSGSPMIVDKFLSGPAGTHWGQLQYFPVVIENDLVFVGINR